VRNKQRVVNDNYLPLHCDSKHCRMRQTAPLPVSPRYSPVSTFPLSVRLPPQQLLPSRNRTTRIPAVVSFFCPARYFHVKLKRCEHHRNYRHTLKVWPLPLSVNSVSFPPLLPLSQLCPASLLSSIPISKDSSIYEQASITRYNVGSKLRG